MSWLRPSAPLLPVLLIAACTQGDPQRDTLHAASLTHKPATTDTEARARRDSINRTTPGYIVDSLLPISEHLSRFRVGLADVDAFSDGLSSAGALVRAIVAGVERADTAALLRLAITRAEFAWLVYPASPYTRPPLRQAPEIVWYLQSGASYQGLNRLLDRLGNTSLGFEGYSCAEPVSQGANTLLPGCVVMDRDVPRGRRLFGTLVERDGRWKVLSYANDY